MDGPAMVLAGALIGLSVAAPVGPMAVLCIKRTLAHGIGAGLSTGLGATTVNVLYGSLLVLGLDEVGPALTRYATSLNLGGAALMLLYAWRLLRATRCVPVEGAAGGASILLAYGSAVLFNLGNPLSVVLLGASIASVLSGGPPPQGMLLVAGVAGGSAAWWLLLTTIISTLRRRLTTGALQAINAMAALALAAFGMLTLARALLGPR